MPTISWVLALSAALVGQARPDFSGAWTLDPARSQTTGAPTRIGGPGPAAGAGGIHEPRRIKHVPPVYPAEAMRAGQCGAVVLEALIDREGLVSDVRVLRSVPGLDEAAARAVLQWNYTPTLMNSQAIEVVMVVTVTFSFDGCSPQPPGPGRQTRSELVVPACAARAAASGLADRPRNVRHQAGQ